MASKSVYQPYEQDALTYFGLEKDPFYGVFSSNEIHDVLITQDVTTFEKVRDILSNNTNATVDLSNYKKAFILPKCPVSSDRIKEACKEHKITVTNDYEKADFIITHDEFYKKFRDGEKILTSMTMYKLWNYEAFPGTNGYVEFVDKYHETTGKSVLWDLRMDEFRSSYRIDDPESLYDECVLPGLAINLAHLVDTNELDVVNVDDMLCQSANKIELTEQLVDEIKDWMSGYQEENFALVAKVLPTIVTDKKEQWVEGVVKGNILDRAQGNRGFGYDPIFYIPELQKTFSELSMAEKNKISHRGLALEKFRILLGKLNLA